MSNSNTYQYVNHIIGFSSLRVKYLQENFNLLNYLSPKNQLFIEIIIIPNSKINLRTFHNRLDLFKRITVEHIIDSYFNSNKSNIFHVLTQKDNEFKLYEELLLEMNEDYLECDYIENKIREMKAVDLYYSGYHIADMYKSIVNY